MTNELTARQVLSTYLARQRMATEAQAEGALRNGTLQELERFLPRLLECEMADGSKLGDLPYAEIRPSHLKAALQAFRFSPGLPRNGKPGRLPSQATVRNVTAYLRMFFKYSDTALGLDRANPCLAIKTSDVVGKRKRDPKQYLTDEQVEILLAEVNEHYRPIVTLLSESGLRSGEARGLIWSDVGENGLTISAQADLDGAQRVPPKTSSSLRFVAFTSATRALFDAQRRWVLNVYGMEAIGPERPVFPTRSGRFFGASNLAKRVSEAAERAGLPSTSPHSLRHYAAKKLLRNGVPVDVVASVLGHASVTTTTSIYSDATASPEEKAEAMLLAFG